MLNDLANAVSDLSSSIDRAEAAFRLARTIPMRGQRIETTREVRTQLASLKDAGRKLTRMVRLRQTLKAEPAISAWERRVRADIVEARRIIRLSDVSIPRLVNSASEAIGNIADPSSRLSTPRLP